ncbi:MAG: alginate export family protein [Acidobacteriota bacterium]
MTFFRTLSTAISRSLVLLVAATLPGLSADTASAQGDAGSTSPEPTFLEALAGGETHLSLRYRFETVDDDGFDDTAEASTLRTALSYTTAAWRGWSLFLEAENVAAVFDDDGYNNAGAGSLNNGVRGVPVIADPEVTEVNQAFVRWRGGDAETWGTATVQVGRQEINLGDQRFVGAVAWRQNHQSFDAVRVQLHLARVDIDYTYADAVLRIVGDHRQMSSHFFMAPIELHAGHRLTPYGVWIDFDAVTSLSTSTFGAEYKGKFAMTDAVGLQVELEAAQQRDAGDNPVEIDTDYIMASVGAGFKTDRATYGVDVAWERLGGLGDGQRAFQTPFATLHKWNGWADKFLATPGPGLDTLYLRLKGSFGPRWRAMLVYHDFSSDERDFDFGSEIDGELVYTAPWRQTFALKFAVYDADDFSTDTEKLMLWTRYAF